MHHENHTKRTIGTWEEQDLYGSWRHLLFWQAGERKKVKRRTHKRERRQANHEIRQEIHDTERT